jgi:hypothetical protein
MTTASKGKTVAVATSPQLPVERPVPLPPILDERKRIDGRTSPTWVARKLVPGEQVPLNQALAWLENRDVPAAVNAIRFHVGKMLNHWNNGRSTATEKDWEIADWERLLDGFAEAHIIEACDSWMKRQRFKPQIADIVSLIEMAQYRDRENIHRCRVLLGLKPPRVWERIPAPVAPAADPKKALAMLDRVTSKLTVVSRPLSRGTDVTGDGAAKVRAENRLARDPEALARLRQLRPITDEKSKT